jgi:ribosome-binding protein aMBF1 (putative translation factor)
VTPDLLARIGRALFGSYWQTALAAEIEVNERTVRRWAAGDSAIPDGIAAELARLLELRAMDIRYLLADLPSPAQA